MLRKKSVEDPELGSLVRQRRMWRGSVTVAPQVTVPLAVPGDGRGPDPEAVARAREIPAAYAACRAGIAAALMDHHPGDPTEDNVAVDPVYAAIIVLDGELATELGYQVPWDDEHTLGARLRNGELIELNGSVLEP